MKKIIYILSCAMLVCTTEAVPLEKEFATKHDFTIYLPSGWIEVPRVEIDRQLDAIYDQYPNVPRETYDYAFQPGSSEYWLEYPYIMIQVRSTGKLTEPPEKIFRSMKAQFVSDLQQEFDKMADTTTGEGSILESFSLDGNLVDWDLGNHVIWMVTRSQVAGVGPVATVMAICLTEKGVMRVGLAVEESDFSHYMPTFREIVNSIQYEPTLKYHPVKHSPKKDGSASILGSALKQMLESAPGIFGLLLIAGLFRTAISFITKTRDKKRKDLWFNGTQADRDAMNPSEEELLRWMKEDATSTQQKQTNNSEK